MKRRAREDKRKWLEDRGHPQCTKSAENGRTTELYQTAKNVTNKQRRRATAITDTKDELVKDMNARLHGKMGRTL